MICNEQPDSSHERENLDPTPESVATKTPVVETTQEDFMPEEDAQAVEERLKQLGYI